MKRLIFPLVALAAVLLGGCGDPAPSTPIAPDQPAPDTSKLTPEQVQALHGGGSAAGSDRGAPAPGGAGGGDATHGTPADRGG